MRTSALFLLFLLLSVPAAAQVTCNTFAQPVTVRADGLSENTGDIVLLCSGGTVPAAGAVLPQFDIIVSLNTNITSRLLVAPATEALLFIDDPQPGTQSPCAPANGNTVCSPMYRGVNTPVATLVQLPRQPISSRARAKPTTASFSVRYLLSRPAPESLTSASN